MNQIIMEETINYEEEREFLQKHNNYGRGMFKDYTTELIPTNLKLPPKPKRNESSDRQTARGGERHAKGPQQGQRQRASWPPPHPPAPCVHRGLPARPE